MMVEYIKAIGKIILCMEKEHIIGQMEKDFKEII